MPSLVTPAIPTGTMSAHPQPALTHDDLTLRPWAHADTPALLRAYEDPAIQRWLLFTLPDETAAHALVNTRQAKWEAETDAYWAVTRSGVTLGGVSVNDVKLRSGYAELGYFTLPEARGQGVAAQAAVAVTRWAFTVGFHRLVIIHSTVNDASCKVAVKAGFPGEGRRASEIRHTDGWHDMHVHARINPVI
jgi:ribosomal-protein-alanine N-acetyltransferase